MKSSILLLAVVSGGIGGAAGAVLTSLALSDDGDARRPAPVTAAPAPAELAELREENARLAERLNRLEVQASLRAGERTAAANPARAESGFDLAEIEALLASLNKPDQPPPAGLQRLVERALEDKEARERAEREEAERIRREERLDERMARMAEELGLDPTQKEQVRAALWKREEAMAAMWREMRNASGRGSFLGDREAVREKFAAIRDASVQAIQAALSPAQFEQYQEKFENDRFGGRGGFGGGDRGGRGN